MPESVAKGVISVNPDQKFFDFINRWAAAQGCTFIEQGCDGRESPALIDGMAADDVWGWLLPEGITQKSDEFFGCIVWNVVDGKLNLTWENKA